MNTSEKRLAANRANAARSTGPRTPEGKARSSRNARTHGFSAAALSAVGLEDVRQLDNLRASAIHDFQPQNEQELIAVERIALAQLSLFRVARLEAGMFTNAINTGLDGDGFATSKLDRILFLGKGVQREQNGSHVLAEGFISATNRGDAWVLFLRYQAQTERLYRRALENFQALKQLRDEMPNEPIPDPDPIEIPPPIPNPYEPTPDPDAPDPLPVIDPPTRLVPDLPKPVPHVPSDTVKQC